jgi:hypothetical protein
MVGDSSVAWVCSRWLRADWSANLKGVNVLREGISTSCLPVVRPLWSLVRHRGDKRRRAASTPVYQSTLYKPQTIIRIVNHDDDDFPTAVNLLQQVDNASLVQDLAVRLVSDGNAGSQCGAGTQALDVQHG